MYSPLEQFKLKIIYRVNNNNYDITITNSTIIIISTIIITVIISKKRIIEEIYKKIEEITIKKYIPIITSIIIFITINNIIGLIPYSYTTTSQIIINITLSMTIIIGVTIIGITKHKYKFINLFKPTGITKTIIPLIMSIEIISYISRIISLSVRLTANMLSGHIMLNLITTYGYKISRPITIIIIIPFIILELGISIIQGYVFTILTSTYIKDSIYADKH